MHVLSLAFCLLLTSTPVIADDFRGLDWGASPSTVRASEKAKFLGANGDVLVFKDTVAGIDVAILYTFSGGRLVDAAYINDEAHSNKNDFINDYTKLKELLVKKYGEPKSDDTTWRNDLYKSDPSEWGIAISVGHLVFQTTWETERTTISTKLRGDNFEITHGVVYEEKASEVKRQEQSEKEALDQL